MLLAMPTAMPVLALTSTLGKVAGSRVGSFHGAVVVVHKVHRVLVNILEQLPADGGPGGPLYREAAQAISRSRTLPKLPLGVHIGCKGPRTPERRTIVS